MMRKQTAILLLMVLALAGPGKLCAQDKAAEDNEEDIPSVGERILEPSLRSPRSKPKHALTDSAPQLLVQVWVEPYTKPEGIRFPVKSGASAEAYLGKEERRDKEFTKRGIRIEVVPTLVSREKVNVGVKLEVAWPGEEPETLGTVTDVDLTLGKKTALFQGEGKRIEILVTLLPTEGR